MIYDITQPLPGCAVYPGDPAPVLRVLQSMEEGSLYNLSGISMCLHNGTHADAPRHFLKDGKGIDGIPLEKFIGPAYVAEAEGELTAEQADVILRKAEQAGAGKKILLKGKPTVTEAAALVFAGKPLDLIGTETQSVGPEGGPMAVHLILLEKETVLLEGICLAEVKEGSYFLNCAPLKVTGGDGAPCRAILFSGEEAPGRKND